MLSNNNQCLMPVSLSSGWSNTPFQGKDGGVWTLTQQRYLCLQSVKALTGLIAAA